MADPIPNQGVVPPDLTSEVGQVRLLVGDTDPSNVTNGVGTYFWYSDDELAALVGLQGSVKSAAIYVLRIVAMTPAMQLRKWQSADLMVDGPAITTALRALIKDIEEGIIATAEAESLDLFMTVNVGAAMHQPALFPSWVPTNADGVPLDPTLPYFGPLTRLY